MNRLVIAIFLMLILILGFFVYVDYDSSKCQKKDSLGYELMIFKLCKFTNGGSYTYDVHSIFFEDKECEVEFTC